MLEKKIKFLSVSEVENKFCDLPALSIATVVTELSQVNFLNSSNRSVFFFLIRFDVRVQAPDLTLRNFNSVTLLTCRLNNHFTVPQYLLVPVVHIVVSVTGNTTRDVTIVLTAMSHNYVLCSCTAIGTQ